MAKKLHSVLRKKLKQTPEFFRKLFLNKRITDDSLSKKYPVKKITGIGYHKIEIDEDPLYEKTNIRLMKVLTEPVTKRGVVLSQDELDSHGSIITIPDMMKMFPKLVKNIRTYMIGMSSQSV